VQASRTLEALLLSVKATIGSRALQAQKRTNRLVYTPGIALRKSVLW
jgi:hypothetical protein